jgi:hypothetical protein
MPQKASTPWSTRTVAEGGTDSPVGDLVPVPDEITPVVNTGFIATSGKYTGIPADDLAFTFQDPSQALAAGADLEIEVNMLNHDLLILAIQDSSGNDINIDIFYKNPTTMIGPYSPFAALGGGAGNFWKVNAYPPGGGDAQFGFIVYDGSEDLAGEWIFWKVIGLRGTIGRMFVHNNEGADAGTISTAFLRLI